MNKSEFLKIEVPTPHVLEQPKIASFLTAIAKKLNKEKVELEALQQLKKGFLQQMFI